MDRALGGTQYGALPASSNKTAARTFARLFSLFIEQAPAQRRNLWRGASLPGGWSTPSSHGWGISKGSKHPDVAWEFLKMITG
jgi:ABC-type glycerol-3-phosphate transport system substrate-binding protein